MHIAFSRVGFFLFLDVKGGRLEKDWHWKMLVDTVHSICGVESWCRQNTEYTERCVHVENVHRAFANPLPRKPGFTGL